MLFALSPFFFSFWGYILLRLAFNLAARSFIYALILLLFLYIITIPLALWLLNKMKESKFMSNYFSIDYHEFLVYKWGISFYQWFQTRDNADHAREDIS
jgi:hypothetical protein